MSYSYVLEHCSFIFPTHIYCVSLPLQEFLKKEYSHENIYFWTACERYRFAIDDNNGSVTKDWQEWGGRHSAASTIYNRHLGPNASEPVNVDSQARQVAQEGLHQPSQDLFAAVSGWGMRDLGMPVHIIVSF